MPPILDNATFNSTAFDTTGANFVLIKPVDSDFTALAAPEDWKKVFLTKSSKYSDKMPKTPVYGNNRKPVGSKFGNKEIMYNFDCMDFSAATEKFFTETVIGTYFAMLIPVGPRGYSVANGCNMFKFRFAGCGEFSAEFEENTPEGESFPVTFIPKENTTGSAVALTNIGALTGLTGIDDDLDLDATDWGAIDVSLAAGKFVERFEVKMKY